MTKSDLYLSLAVGAAAYVLGAPWWLSLALMIPPLPWLIALPVWIMLAVLP